MAPSLLVKKMYSSSSHDHPESLDHQHNNVPQTAIIHSRSGSSSSSVNGVQTGNHVSSVNQHHSSSNGVNGSGSKSSSFSLRHPIISMDSICINKELGTGEFGVVQQGVWTNEEGERIQVAIKCLSKERMQNNSSDFMKEASMMHSIDHEHIVRLYGVVLESTTLMLVTELAPLRSLLECLKEPSLRQSFPVICLADFSFQVASGMSYLESKRLIHRDLAARNILVFARNKVKISDFGLSRALGVGKDYYQTNFNVNLKLPIAWCAPECINYLKFTSASDVWAYGVTLWEMFSYGFQPWAALTGQQILEAIDEPNGQRLEQPDSCPKEYYSLMLKCWSHDPGERPKFADIEKLLPDCRPEMVQVIKEVSSMSDKKDLLSCKLGDIITVLDKSPTVVTGSQSNGHHHHSLGSEFLWKGSLMSGKTGLFDPSQTVTYLGQSFPLTPIVPVVGIGSSSSSTSGHQILQRNPSLTASTTSSNSSSSFHHNHLREGIAGLSANVLQGKQFIRGLVDVISQGASSSLSGIYSSKRKLKRDMISMPQSDFKHTGHVGVDGAFFGDLGFLGEKYQLPSRTTLTRTSSDLSDRAPLLSNSNNGEEGKGSTSSQEHSSRHASSGATGGMINHSMNLSLKDLKPKHNTRHNHNHTRHQHHRHSDSHEYHEVTETEDSFFLESPHFETLDFGPSLMDEVFRELDTFITKPDMTSEVSEQQSVLNDCSSNVKNEIKEIIVSASNAAKQHQQQQNQGNKDSSSSFSASFKNKNKCSVKPISGKDEQTLDQAINLAKELARSMDHDNFAFASDNEPSPKTPNSPNKKSTSGHTLFSFPKFHLHSSPKAERRTFSEEAENIPGVESIISQEAKDAYSSLIENRKPNPIPVPVRSSSIPKEETTTTATDNEANPLRMLRSGQVAAAGFTRVKGNKRLSSNSMNKGNTSSAAGISSTRSSLGTPPPIPTTIPGSGSSAVNNSINQNNNQSNSDPNNALPLPPKSDLTTLMKVPLKHHQRKHPLLIPHNTLTMVGSQFDHLGSVSSKMQSQQKQTPQPLPLPSNFQSLQQKSDQAAVVKDNLPALSTFRPLGAPPLLKQVSCPEPPVSFQQSNNPASRRGSSGLITATINSNKSNGSNSSLTTNDGLTTVDLSVAASLSTPVTISSLPLVGKTSIPVAVPAPPKPARIFADDEVSFEEQVQSAIDNLRMADVKASVDDLLDLNPSNGHDNNSNVAPAFITDGVKKSDQVGGKRNLLFPDKGVDSDEVRVIQKVLANEVTLDKEDCVDILNQTEWDVHRGIKCIRLRQTLKQHNIPVEESDFINTLKKYNWNVRQAGNFLIATLGSNEGSSEV